MPPAARLGDSTNHAGDTIGPVVSGMTVMIGYMPAACLGDPHVCPLSDGPKPHVGGTILKGSATVLIANKPAARVNDPTECKGPPGMIAMGCNTVLIGDSGGGGGGGAGGGGGSFEGEDSFEISTEAPVEGTESAGGGPSSTTIGSGGVSAGTSGGPQGGGGGAPAPVVHALLTIEEVDFAGNHVVEKDTLGLFGSPEWRSGRPADEQAPVCYTRGVKVQVRGRFRVTRQPTRSEPVQIRARTTVGGVTLEFTGTVTVAPGDTTVQGPLMSSDNALPNEVACFDPARITWENNPANEGWASAGSSSHTIYLVLKAPSGTPVYWTLVDISCRAAAGETTEAGLVSRSYAPFTTRALTRKRDNHELTYWNPTSTTATNTRQLLAAADGSGQCGSWSELLIDMWKVHGITNADKILIVRTVPEYQSSTTGFLVKNWLFAASGSRPAPFTHVMGSAAGSECQDLPGVPGQRNPDPPPAFFNHFIVRHGGKFYDPSYGTGPVADQGTWENASIEGLFSGGAAGFQKSLNPANLLEFWNLTTRQRI